MAGNVEIDLFENQMKFPQDRRMSAAGGFEKFADFCSFFSTRSMLVLLAFAKVQRRFRNRWAPSTLASDHSSVCSGGEANMMKKRAVSAPYFSIKACGSTPLRLDFDMVPMPW